MTASKALRYVIQPIAIIGLCLSLWGCATGTTGRDFDASKVRQIVKRKTTAKTVLAMFGEPSHTYQVKPTGEGWTYSFETAAGTTGGYRKRLTVLFDKNKLVVNYWLHQGAITGQQAQTAARKPSPLANDGRTTYLDGSPLRTAVATPRPAPPMEQRRQSDAGNAQAAKRDLSAKAAPKGPVRTTVANQSPSPLTLRVERNGSTVAEVRMLGQERKNVLLAHGDYGLKLRLNNQYYRAPGFSIALNTASINLIWKDSNLARLQPISEAEFER
jgi:outer membrane protein assembly factor BamE (lipoprotein component of BamABCDE complex)